MRTTLTTLATLALLSIPAAASGLSGDYGINCQEGNQCWIEFRPANGGIDYRWVTADRMDANKVKCEVTGRLDVLGGSAGGPFEDRTMTVSDNGDGTVNLVTGGNTACGQNLVVDGNYQFYGDF